MLNAVVYIVILLNSIFLVSIFFFFRSYIQRELRKNEYIRNVEKELEEFVLGMNQGAEQITQLLEDKIEQLQKLLYKHDEVKRGWSLMEHGTEQQAAQLVQLKQDTQRSLQSLRSEIDALGTKPDKQQDTLQEKEQQKLLQKLHAQMETIAQEQVLPKLYKDLQEKLQAETQLKSQTTNDSFSKNPLSENPQTENTTEKEMELGKQILDPKLRKEIEHYIELGLDSRIIQQKTGANLGLIEILIGMKEI